MLKEIKLGIVGSREITDYKLLKKLVQMIPYKITEIVSGGARGVDMMARLYSLEHAIPLTEFIPDWEGEGKSAGVIRNQALVAYCDYLIILWDGVSKGTEDDIKECIQQNKPFIPWDLTQNHEYKIYNLGYPDGKDCKYSPGWKTWCGMLKRVSEGVGQYSKVFIDPSWLFFSNFSRWYKKNKIFDWEMDKDLMSEGKHDHYGPDVCVYLPKEINQQLQRHKGIEKDGSGFVPVMHHGGEIVRGKSYLTEEDAREEYIEMKRNYIEELVDNYSFWLLPEVQETLLNYKWI